MNRILFFLILLLYNVQCSTNTDNSDDIFDFLTQKSISELNEKFVMVVVPDRTCQSCQTSALAFMEILSKNNATFILTDFQSEKKWKIKLNSYMPIQNIIFDKNNEFSHIIKLSTNPTVIFVTGSGYTTDELTFENENTIRRKILDFIYEN